MFDFFKKKQESFLGIDIGTTGIKAVQLGFENGNIKLENYGYKREANYLSLERTGMVSGAIKMSDADVAKDLENIIRKSGMNAKKVVMSVPISSSFSAVISLPEMPEDEISRAVNFEARQYIPIPLEEVVFGWNVVGKDEAKNNVASMKREESKIKVILVAIPREITESHAEIAKAVKLRLTALETESFSLARSLVGKKEGSFAIVDIGDKTTSMTIVENGNVVLSRNITGAGGEEISKIISHGFNVDLKRAESLKKDVGLTFSGTEKKVSEIILPVISVVVSEIRKIRTSYYRTSGIIIKKVILTGGTINMPGLVDYFAKELDISLEIGDPWQNVVYDKILSEKLKELAIYFSVAVGLALKGFDDSNKFGG